MKKTTSQLGMIPAFREFINASARGWRLTPSGKRIAIGTITGYNYALRLLEEFKRYRDDSLRITLLHSASLRDLQREKNYWSWFYAQFSDHLYRQKGYYDNYVASIFKIIRTFFNYLQVEKGLSVGNYHRSFKVPLQKTTPVVLQPWQLQFLIMDKEFENGLNPYLKRAKDIFVVGCTVALRVSDLMNLKKKDLLVSGDEACLSVTTQKTGAQVKIPLPGYALQIIEKCKRKAGSYLLPRLSVTNLNIQLKKLIQKAGWNFTLVKNLSRRGKMIELKNNDGKSWQFYDHITAHTMGRTAITTLHVNLAKFAKFRKQLRSLKRLAALPFGTVPLLSVRTHNEWH